MLARRVCALLLLGSVTACSSENPVPVFGLYPQAVTLTPVAYTDSGSTEELVSVLNETYFPLVVRNLEVIGPGASFLTWGTIQGGQQTLQIRDVLAIPVKVRPPTDQEVRRWSSGTFQATMKFEVAGSGAIDAETQKFDPDAEERVQVEVPISFSIVCDLDQDGYDSTRCSGGRDCDDAQPSTNPDAIEYCDGVDSDCDLRDDLNDDCVET
ncbi:MAG: putative metal-binding motif-containing protein [Alphaproteobacteria bacterium]|nr:putative metal-binding motif-containing protein [Alphaproteobacteria bacterium]